MDTKTYTGVVKNVMDKGYGFITCEELGRDVFYHNNDLPAELAQRKLRQGDKVQFVLEQDQKTMKDKAVQIKLLGDEGMQEAA